MAKNAFILTRIWAGVSFKAAEYKVDSSQTRSAAWVQTLR